MWKQAGCVIAVFSVAILLSTRREDWFGALLLCALAALPLLIFCLLLMEPDNVKILRHGDRKAIRAYRKRIARSVEAYPYAGYDAWCEICDCRFELLATSEVFEYEDWSGDIMVMVRCPDCGFKIQITAEECEWVVAIKGKSHEEIQEMQAERDKAKEISADRAEEEQGCVTGEDIPEEGSEFQENDFIEEVTEDESEKNDEKEKPKGG